ncbi:MAG: peptidyl-prolyl cis-trans isomerase [Planctomycetes bacterium]|nr:peptidyl-prolyl cis-trans isomerase [Planctomycetota bacterium]
MTLLRAFVFPALLGICCAQDGASPAPVLQAAAPHFVVRRWPEDKDLAIAVVGARTLTLNDLIDHIQNRHYPRFRADLEAFPTVRAMLQSDLMAAWVRQLADIEALRQTYGAELADDKKLEAAMSAALKARFQGHLDAWAGDERQRGRSGELSQDKVNRMLTQFQWHNGLGCELQGMLDHLEGSEYSRQQLHGFFTANPRYFGGQVTIQHIMVQHRDAGTGILLNDEGIARANERLAAIKASIAPDGSNFEEVARARSEDTRTARNGGLLKGLHRYDDRMPAALCKAAWELKDGEVSDVVETQYGLHLVKRLEYTQNVFILFTDDAMPTIKTVMQRAMQERRLLEARQKTGLRLML